MPRPALAALLLTFLAAIAVASDWPHLRGPDLDGAAPLPAGIDDEELGLDVSWRVPLGSGYSGIAAVSDRAVTLFSDGGSDWVGAFDLSAGREIWRHRLDSVNRGRNGSADGPISSPVIDSGRVFAIGPKGQLVALALTDGKVIWSKSMLTDFGAREPDFGFGVTPLVVDGKLVILNGGESGAVTALDPGTGETLWSAGEAQYRYQIPVTLSAGGRAHVVAASGTRIVGFDPEDGAELWEHQLGEDEGIDGALTAAGEGRFLVFIQGQAVMFRLERAGEAFGVRELYRTQELGRTYALPVFHDGHLYGFRGQILTCVEAATGERVWRSRPPGGRGLILVGDSLAVFGADGQVVLADATPAGYVERARVQALSSSGYTWPSFAGGRILVRNLEELTAVAVSPTRRAAMPDSTEVGGAFGRFVSDLVAAIDKSELIEEYLSQHATLPIIEGRQAHFAYVGEAEDMAILGTMTPRGGPEVMTRVPGTDFFYRSYPLALGGRWEYQFIKNFEERLADPRNPHRVPPREGREDASEFWLPGYSAPDHIAERADGVKGTVEVVSFKSETQDLEREVHVYLPPGYQNGEERYPLLIVHDGTDWLEKGLMNNTLDNLIGSRARPLVVAFLKVREDWWLEAGGTGTDEHVDMLARDLLPLLEKRYRLRTDPGSRGLMGNTGYGVTSAYAALKRPDLFGKVAIQSVQLGLGYEDRLFDLIRRDPKADVVFYLDWSEYEIQNLDSGIDLGVDSRRLADALSAGGYEFVGGEAEDSAGWGGWRARTDRILEALFPPR